MGKNHSNKVERTMECEEPFQAVKTALQELILKDYVQSVLYISRKLNKHEV